MLGFKMFVKLARYYGTTNSNYFYRCDLRKFLTKKNFSSEGLGRSFSSATPGMFIASKGCDFVPNLPGYVSFL
jgi:hypothetical protein